MTNIESGIESGIEPGTKTGVEIDQKTSRSNSNRNSKSPATRRSELSLGGSDWREVAGSILEKYWRAIFSVVGAVALGALVYSVFQYFERRSEAKAEDALYAAEGPFVKAKESYERARMKALMPGLTAPDEPSAPAAKQASGNITTDYGPSIANLEEVLNLYPKSHAGQQAALDLISVYGEYKQPDKALAVASKAGAGALAGDVLGALTLAALGDAQATKGQCNDAVNTWKKILDEARASYLHAEVAVKSGICFETLKDSGKAAEMYRKTSQDFGESAAAHTAKSLLRALEFRSANGKSS